MTAWLAPGEALAAVAAGIAVGGIARLALRPAPRLSARVRPYAVEARAALGQRAGVAETAGVTPDSVLLTARSPAVARVAAPLVGALGRVAWWQDADALRLRLRQAGLLGAVPPAEVVPAFRFRQLGSAAAGGAVGAVLALVTGLGAGGAVALVALGIVAGAAHWPARLDRELARRRERLRLELYTINLLLALQLRAGSGVVQALGRIARRGSGALVDEITEILTAHRGGRSLADALEQAARETPEPNAARTYRLLATGSAFGADLADGLRTLSDDIRRQRVETLKRAATRRRAAALVPIIGLLAPVLLLFIAAPLPSLVLHGP